MHFASSRSLVSRPLDRTARDLPAGSVPIDSRAAALGSFALTLTVLIQACAASTVPERTAPAPAEWIEGEPMYEVLPPDAIGAIDEPRFVDALRADEFLAPDEPVLGVVGEQGTIKCYSAWQLEGHEIVNDELDGRAIAVTW